MTNLIDLPKLDELTGKNREWAKRFMADAETHDLPAGLSVGDLVSLDMGNGSRGEAEILGANTGADGDRWLALWGLRVEADAVQFPCWVAKAHEVTPL